MPQHCVSRASDKPRYSLQRRLAAWTILLVIVPMIVYAFWLNRLVYTAVLDHHARNVAMLGQTLAVSLAGRLEGNERDAEKVLDALDLDQRLAFVIVTDPSGSAVHRRVTDSDAYVAFDQHYRRRGWLETERPIVLGRDDDLVVHKTPVWNPPIYKRPTDGSAVQPQRELEGFVILALREKSLPGTMDRLLAMQVVAAVVVCAVSVPVVVVAVRRWLAPLRALLGATVALGAGRSPSPVPVATRDELGLLAESFNDMATNLSAAQLGLQRANAELENKVKSRTCQLEHANARLESEFNDRNEFLRAVTHDLSAPLRNINGMATMLLMKYGDQLADDAQQKLERINANVQVQNELIDDLLELSRLRTRSSKRERIDLNDVVAALRDNLSYDLDRGGITLITEDPLPTIVGDRNRIRQVFQNLLDNAVKYMLDAPTRRIIVSHYADDQFFHFTVADTGSGISAEDLPHVFEMFRRATHSGTHHVAGRGVGLAGVKTIIELYGGQIQVVSESGQGSEFHFSLARQLVTPDNGSVVTQSA